MSEMAALHPDPDSGALDGDEDELFDEATLRQQVLLSCRLPQAGSPHCG